MEVYLETFDVADMLAEVQATIEPLVAKNGNRLVVEAAADLGDDALGPDQGPADPVQPPEQRRQVHPARARSR